MVSGYQAKYTRKELEEKVDSLEASAGDMTAITNIQNTITNVQGDITNLQQRVGVLEGAQSSHDARIKRLEDTINNTPDLPSNQDITYINTRISGLQTDITELKAKVDVLYGVQGIQTSISASGSIFTLNPDYHYNIITTTAGGQKIELSSNGFNKMKDGQELYVFVNGSYDFLLNILGATTSKIVGLGGGIIGNGKTITPESELTEISIIKIGSGVYVRLA